MAFANEVIDFVFLEEEFDAFGHLRGHVARAAHDFGEVEGDVFGGDAVNVALFHFLVEFGAFEEGFCWDAAPVEAGAAGAFEFDAGDFFAELSGADRACVACGPAANDNKIVFRGCSHVWWCVGESVKVAGLVKKGKRMITKSIGSYEAAERGGGGVGLRANFFFSQRLNLLSG